MCVYNIHCPVECVFDVVMQGDIAGRTSALEAIQLLGYCLFTPQFAE